MLDTNMQYSAMGDFEERFYSIAQKKGYFRARLFYRTQILLLFPQFIKNLIHWSFEMFKNYLKITVRNLTRHKGYSFINIFGLAVGMACCILILLWVSDELSYDRHFKDADRIYRVTYAEEIGGAHDHYALSPFPAAPVFKEELPEVTAFTRLWLRSGLLTYENKKFDETGIYYVDPDFFNIFSLEFLSGSPDTALNSPGSIVLTEDSAKKIFRDADPIGKSLNLNADGDLKVTGVIKNIPRNTHFKFNYLVSINTIQGRRTQYLEGWLWIAGWSYIKLSNLADPSSVEEKMKDIVESHTGEEARQNGIKPFYFLQKMTDIHLKSRLEDEIEGNGNIFYVYIFSIVALFILLIACINFMNLSTARSANRGREVGLRKVFGAYRKRLIGQFITESAFLSFLGLIFALFIVWLLLPAFNNLTGKSISLGYLHNRTVYAAMFGLILFTGVAAGSYPAFFLSSFQPVKVLRGKIQQRSGKSALRSALVILQFSISVFLLISTFIILGQLKYMKNQNLGFDKDLLLAVRVKSGAIRQQPEAFKNELLQNTSIKKASYSDGIPGRVTSVLTIFQEGKAESESLTFNVIFADYDYIKTYGIKLVSGRDFSQEFSTDKEGAFLLNETAAAKLEGREKALGKKIGFSLEDLDPVVGIVKDFHYRSLKEVIGPLAISLSPESSYLLSVKINSNTIGETISFIKKTYEKFEKSRRFEYFFIDENFDSLYHSEERLSRIISFFSFIAILVACLGLFGLASFTAEQSTKEIGIRKVLGASVGKIVLQFSKNYIKWVLAANLITWPLTYFVLKTYWLTNFPFRISISIWIFIAAGAVSIIISLITVSYQSIRAATRNPVDALRTE
jgi:ABC-type antimicrobial peptide transport system permease subunit